MAARPIRSGAPAARLGGMAVIEVQELQKRYGETVALDGVSFDVQAGEGFGLIPGFGDPSSDLSGQSGTEYIAWIGVAIVLAVLGPFSPFLQHVSDVTPLGAALQAVRDTWQGSWPHSIHLATMAAWALVAALVAARTFCWE
jgi:hypothetical protein